MPLADWQPAVRDILASDRQFVIAVTGGGSGAIAALVQTPGASRAVLEAVVPYSLPALVDWLGGEPDKACSEPTARAMAMAALIRAQRLAPDADPLRLVGVGCTASLASDRPKRGEHRVHVAVQTAERTAARSVMLDKADARRDAEEEIVATLVLGAIAGACGIAAPLPLDKFCAAINAQHCETDEASASAELTDLLLERRQIALVQHRSSGARNDDGDSKLPQAVFPGAFNPPHAGHVRMAAIAEARLGTPVAWELSIANVDKPPLDFIAIRERVEALRQVDEGRTIALTHAPTFREKAELFPGAAFVVGADTVIRIAEPRYYGGDATRRDEAIASLATYGCRFLVFGRTIEGQFQTLSDIALPLALRDLCDEVRASEFREDVSSSDLRRVRAL